MCLAREGGDIYISELRCLGPNDVACMNKVTASLKPRARHSPDFATSRAGIVTYCVVDINDLLTLRNNPNLHTVLDSTYSLY